jgi:hypothetical protein
MKQCAGKTLVIQNGVQTFIGKALLDALDLIRGIPRDETNGELRVFS